MPRSNATWLLLLVVAFGAGRFPAGAKIQFDVFPGFDSVARAGAWYPVGIEIFNDGPGFDGVVELDAGQGTLRIPIELPSNTRKRFTVPLFNVSRNFLAVDGRLLDDRGKVRDEQLARRVTVQGWEVPLMGALPGSFTGAPAFPELSQSQPAWQPRVARLQPELFPDSPIALSGLNSLYLNTARALELKEPQVQALVSWVEGGGQLIVAVDQPTDVTATPWLQSLLPASPSGLAEAPIGRALDDWVRAGNWRPEFAARVPDTTRSGATPSAQRFLRRSPEGVDPFVALVSDGTMASAAVPVLGLRPRGGRTALSSDGRALIVEGRRGLGQVVVLAFNPEREPLRSWSLRPWFFARLADIPAPLLAPGDRNPFGSRGLDSVFGAMVETRQVRKLPVGLLLLLLLGYLVVIGPFDQWWLRRINRPMLTWITFPLYVVLFSGLIYFIGYKLRAGQTEWNELQVVDVVPRGDGGRCLLRGWSFGSLYSPANETYALGSSLPVAAVRGEFRGLWGAGPDASRITVTARPQGFDAEVFVPVWTSTMAVADWEEDDAPAPIQARNTDNGQIEIRNDSGRTLGPLWVVGPEGMQMVPELAAGATRVMDPREGGADRLDHLMASWNGRFQGALSQRDETFGGGERVSIDDWPEAAVAASFPAAMQSPGGSYVWPAGFDLAPLLTQGDVVVMAWYPDATLTPPLNRFESIRSRKGTLLRIAVPAEGRP
ncbi:MAG: hypothetical protein KF791_03950 [Verrucomicrobiae bacterium]|nr:hypothetical protein [Verrucomicrobiae bacterium]